VSWLLVSPDSPVHPLLLTSAGLLNFLALIHIVPTMLSMVASNNVHGGSDGEVIYWILILVQWFIVGLGLSFLFSIFRGRTNDTT
jgi:NADH:ubiquinone oxidoreductase subunit K